MEEDKEGEVVKWTVEEEIGEEKVTERGGEREIVTVWRETKRRGGIKRGSEERRRRSGRKTKGREEEREGVIGWIE